jgi:hypothetical protein
MAFTHSVCVLSAVLSPFPLQNKSDATVADAIALVNIIAAVTVRSLLSLLFALFRGQGLELRS